MTVAHTDRAHAKLSPSASHRWINCPGSIRLSGDVERKSSFFADEGTAAHTLAAHCLIYDLAPKDFQGQWININGQTVEEQFFKHATIKLDGDGGIFEVTGEMVESVEIYVDYVRGLCADADAERAIEFRFDLQHVADGMFGTGDAVIYNPATQGLHVVDFKYGRGVPVEPEENSQLLSYGLGAVKRHHNRGLASVVLAVVQPRCRHPKGPVREWETNAVGLMDFEHDIRVAAAATAAPNAPLKAGEWCKFCPAAATCPANRDHALSIAASEFATDEGIDPEILAKVPLVAAWCKRVLEAAHDQAVAGNVPKGWKLVEKRATRRWKDEATIVATLKTVYDLADGDIWKPQEVASPAQIERLMPGKNKEARAAVLKPLVIKQSSGAVLVPEHDTRAPVRGDGSEFLEGMET